MAPQPTAVLTALVAVAALAPVGLAAGSGILVGSLTARHSGGPAGSVGSGLVAAVVALAVLFFLQQAVTPIALAVAEDAGRRLDRAVAGRVMAALQRPVSLDHLDHPQTTALLATISGGFTGSTLRDAMVGAVNISVVRGSAASGLLLMLLYRWWLAGLLLVAYAFAMTIVSRSYQRALASAEGAPARLRRAMYVKQLVSTAPAAKEVRLFGLAAWLLDRYRTEWWRALHEVRAGRAGVLGVSLGSGAATLVAQGLTFLLLAFDVAHGRLSVASFTTLTVAATALLGMTSVNPDLVNVSTGGSVLAAVGDLEDLMVRYPSARPGRAMRPRHAIVVEDLSFRYPRGSGWVLRHLDLTVPIGASTAIVGLNGAGKTTLVKLLCGLYQPTEGRILVDGVDLREFDLTWWQRQFAALPQDWIRWPLPVRDNVSLGAPWVHPSAAALDAAARASGLDAILAGLPEGWSTVLSREFGGVDLSGGQWQRVGLARALFGLSAGAEVLVLDEPTAALDVRGEAELYDLLLTAASAKTILLISHRFSTVRHADQIVVLADGTVRERDDHTGLMAAGGEYASMFRLQADRFSGPALR